MITHCSATLKLGYSLHILRDIVFTKVSTANTLIQSIGRGITESQPTGDSINLPLHIIVIKNETKSTTLKYRVKLTIWAITRLRMVKNINYF